MELKHEEGDTKGRFYFEDNGNHLAEITYSIAGQELIIIDHTEVDESLSGQGYGQKLVEAVIAKAQEQGKKILPLCPFANAFFKKHPEHHPILK